MSHLRGKLVHGAYMAITCKADIAVGCVLAHIGKYVGLHSHLS